MVIGKFVKKCLAVASAAVLVVSVVAGDYCTAYASVSITEAGEYFLQMMCSAVGVYIDKSNIGLVLNAIHHVADQQALIGSPEFQKQVDYMISLSPADRIDATFSNDFLKNLCGVFAESTVNEDGFGGGGITFPVSGVSLSTDLTSIFSVESYFGIPSFTEDVNAIAAQYDYVIVTAKSDLENGYIMYAFNDVSMPIKATKTYVSVPCASYGYVIFDRDGAYCNSYTYNNSLQVSLNKALSVYFSTDIVLRYGDIDYGAKGSVVAANRVWIDAYDEAMLHVPAVTAPITIPLDVASMEENAKAVAAADNADALYKALAAAGIAIDIGIDVPDETDKPTDAEIPDDNTGAIGKSLTDILAAITGLADKVAAIPREIAAFFTPDMTAVSESFDSLKDSLMLKFGGLLQLADVFNRSYKFDTVIPVIKIPIPDNETLRTIFDHKTELVILDLTPFASDFQNFRILLTAMLYVAFAFWFLDEFDVKIHIG